MGIYANLKIWHAGTCNRDMRDVQILGLTLHQLLLDSVQNQVKVSFVITYDKRHSSVRILGKHLVLALSRPLITEIK